MDSPFPGMDPYLESQWGDVHQSLVIYARDQLQIRLPADLRARTEARLVIGGPADAARVVYPDVGVFRPRRSAEPEGNVAVAVAADVEVEVARPLVFRFERERPEAFIEVVEPAQGDRVVTVIEVLSPANKRPGRDQRDYLQKRDDLCRAGVNFVEIDLLRGGERVPMTEPGQIPEAYRTPYQVAVRRGWGRDLLEIYRVPLRERLPAIAVPLRDTDRDVPLDLQPLVAQAYRNGRYGFLNYEVEADPPLAADDASWADELLRARGRRGTPR